MSYNEDYCHKHILNPISSYKCPQCEVEDLIQKINKLEFTLQQITTAMIDYENSETMSGDIFADIIKKIITMKPLKGVLNEPKY